MRRSHTELRIWQEAHSLALRVYELTDRFPAAERFHVVDQMRRASTSVAATIAEGDGRVSPRDFAHFLAIARGSAHEMLNHCRFACDRGYLTMDETNRLLTRYRGLAAGIYAYMKKLLKK